MNHMEGTGRGRLFIGVMHGSTVQGASSTEPPLRKDSDIAAIGKIGICRRKFQRVEK